MVTGSQRFFDRCLAGGEHSRKQDGRLHLSTGYGHLVVNGLQCTARAGKLPEVAEAHAARAVVLLRQATDRGLAIFKEEARPDSLRRDPDFATLRTRADFQALLTALEAKEKRPAP